MAETNKEPTSAKGAQVTNGESVEQKADGAAKALEAKLSGPLAPLEKALDDIFGKKAPYQLPKNIKDSLVEFAPWLALISGILGVFGAYGLWQAAHKVDRFLSAWGMDIKPELGLTFWLSIAMMLVFAALALLAFPGLKAKKKTGWNLMFYSMLANIAYGVVSLFQASGGFGSLLSSVIVSLIGLYLLFQVRAHYKA